MLRLALCGLVLAIGTVTAAADPKADCQQRRDLERRIKGCTLIIEAKATDKPEFLALAYLARADAYTDKGQYDQAVSDASKSIEIGATAASYNQRAWTLYKAGKAAQGLPDANKAIELRPDSAEFLDTRGHIYEALGKNDDAVADYRRVIALEPKNPEFKEDRDAIRRLTGKP